MEVHLAELVDPDGVPRGRWLSPRGRWIHPTPRPSWLRWLFGWGQEDAAAAHCEAAAN